MRIMSVDFGDVRTGLAVCDPSEFMATPLLVITERDMNKTAVKTCAAALDCGAGMIVVGLPKNMDGSCGSRAEKCLEFADMLAGMCDIPIKMWDERVSTMQAARFLNDTNTRGKKRKEKIDSAAAAIILDSFLTYRKNNTVNDGK